MGKNSRTKNSFINSSIGTTTEIINNLINFGIRTIFIYYLSIDYLGLNGLFSNILNLLNLAELGFGTAITYNLYKPVANEDKERIKSLVKLYKVIYRIIGLVVLVLGVSVIPFMGYIVTDAPNISENIILIYSLYLAQIIGTYLFGYKRSVFTVYQKNYINSLVDFTLNTIKAVIQIVILVVTQNYILYLLTFVITTILSNFVIAIIVNKKYPFLKEKEVKKISRKELKEMLSNVKYLVISKFGNVIQNGTDNILLTMLVGLTAVGMYSNYNTVLTAVYGVLRTLLIGMKGSIGNLNAQATNEKKEEIFLQINFITSYLYGIVFVCLSVLLNPFVTIWIGDSYVFPIWTVTLFVSCVYLRGTRFPVTTYSETLGLFKEGRYAPLASAIINIVLSIILGKMYGTPGIFLATIIATFVTVVWYNPYLLYKKRLDTSPKKYFHDTLYYMLVTIIVFLICYKVDSYMPLTGILGFIIRCISTFALSNVLMLAFVCWKKEFKEVKKKCFNIIRNK